MHRLQACLFSDTTTALSTLPGTDMYEEAQLMDKLAHSSLWRGNERAGGVGGRGGRVCCTGAAIRIAPRSAGALAPGRSRVYGGGGARNTPVHRLSPPAPKPLPVARSPSVSFATPSLRARVLGYVARIAPSRYRLWVSFRRSLRRSIAINLKIVYRIMHVPTIAAQLNIRR